MPHEPMVLVVDDNESLLLSCARALYRAGYVVLLAHDGAAALEQLRVARAPIALWIVDLRLPDIAGPELVRRAGVTSPVLYISGDHEEAARAVRRRNRADKALMLKPFTLESLTDRVAGLLGSESVPDPAPRVAQV